MRLSLFAVAALCVSSLAAHAVTITSATLTGSLTDPTITITGSGFGTSAPKGTVAESGYTGRDFGPTALSFHDEGALSFNAGQSDLSGTRNDSIGLVLSTYTDDEIVFTLGSKYQPDYADGEYQIQPGDLVNVEVDGITNDFFAPSTVTPEPSSFALLGTGLLGVAGVVRKRFA